MNKTLFFYLMLILSLKIQAQNECSWCGTFETPKNTTWETIICSNEEPGQRIIITGVVYKDDGKTPAPNVKIYVYHTNIKGLYPKRGNETGNGKYHGYLRGWMITDINGRYKFETIKPAPYPTHEGEPAHIHYTIEAEGYPEYWLTGLWFEDDPLVTPAVVKNVERNGGFSNVTKLIPDKNGVLRGIRNIKLERF